VAAGDLMVVVASPWAGKFPREIQLRQLVSNRWWSVNPDGGADDAALFRERLAQLVARAEGLELVGTTSDLP
jgi:hypothetical protein